MAFQAKILSWRFHQLDPPLATPLLRPLFLVKHLAIVKRSKALHVQAYHCEHDHVTFLE